MHQHAISNTYLNVDCREFFSCIWRSLYILRRPVSNIFFYTYMQEVEIFIVNFFFTALTSYPIMQFGGEGVFCLNKRRVKICQ